jgi:uncharacterized protein (DUF58 family)
VADTPNYLDPKTLNKVASLELKARKVVEGTLSGLHRSPYRGFSIEFAEHREYVPGDELRHLDWKVYGRSDRFYIKQYEEETNLRAMLCVDLSKSMDYLGDDAGMSKRDYASTVAASLAHLLLGQRDAVGMVLFDREVAQQLPWSSNQSHLHHIVELLEKAETRPATDIGATLHQLADQLPRRGLILLFSDLFDDPDRTLAGLRHLRHRDHEVILCHVMDRHEIEFPFRSLTRFEGLEASEPLMADPNALREAYLEEVEQFRTTVREGCLANGVDYIEMVTDQALDVALTAYLATRASRRGARTR